MELRNYYGKIIAGDYQRIVVVFLGELVRIDSFCF